MSFRARHLFYTQRHTLNTRRHHRWCLCVVGVFSTPSDACRTRGDTTVGVFSCSASFLHPATHAEHKETPSLVSFRARHLFYIHQCTPNMRRHHRWCLFVLCAYPASPDARRVVCPHCSTNLFSTIEGLAPSLNIICILLQIK